MAMEGRERVLRRLQAIQGAPRKAMRQAIEMGAQQIAASAKNLAPKKTGALAASIGYTFGSYKAANANVRGVSAGNGEGDPDLSATVHAGDAKAFYAAFLEFGVSPHKAGGMFEGAEHPGAQASPFFFPAYRMNKRSVKSRISRAAKKAIKDAR